MKYTQSQIQFVTAECKARARSYLEPADHGTYVCPICGSGTGPKRTGISTRDGGEHWTCWTGCFTNADIIDIIGLEHGYPLHSGGNDPDFIKKLELAAWELDVPFSADQNSQQPAKQQKADRNTAAEKPAPQPAVDYRSYYAECVERLPQTAYRRGFSLEALKKYRVGFDPAWTHPKRPQDKPTPRLIIPITDNCYIARYAGSGEVEYPKMITGQIRGLFWNAGAIRTAEQPIFIVEGAIDAMSIMESGGTAVALNSTNAVDRFLAFLKQEQPSQPLIIALDNDLTKDQGGSGAGQAAALKLHKGLSDLGIVHTEAVISGDQKDANELFMKDPEALKRNVQEAMQAAADQADQEQAEEEKYYQLSAGSCLQDFMNGISERANTRPIPTGFPELDKFFDGGLWEGFYVIGAISSLGKTSFCLQMFDQIAAAGQDVLIFSLEMSRYELISRSISRETAIISLESADGDIRNAKSSRGITAGHKYRFYTEAERNLINAAILKYSGYADHVYISEGIGDIGVAEIRASVDRHIRITGNRPVVLVDYLQILAPADIRGTDKQNTDKAVMELKRISRDYKIPVVAVSSFNRDNYDNVVSMRAFKESGSVEYSCDVLLGMQFRGAGAKGFDADAAAAKEPREIELKILKNRNGPRTKTPILYEYYPVYNLFAEA